MLAALLLLAFLAVCAYAATRDLEPAGRGQAPPDRTAEVIDPVLMG